jgi:putative MATE family efflux protein
MNRDLVGEVWRLVVPVILQGLVVTVVFFTDRLLIGQYSATGLASMQISGPLMWSVFSVFNAFSAGTMAVIGRAVGAEDSNRARHTLSSVLVLGLCIGIVVTAAGMGLRPWFADVLASGTDSVEAQQMAIQYMGATFLAVPFNLVQVCGITALQADGDTKTPMWISAFTGISNLLISWVLLWGYGPFPELGILGTGIGSLVALILGSILVLISLWVRQGHSTLRPYSPPSWHALRPVLKLSIPAFGEKLVFHSAFVMFAAYVGHLGQKAMAANQALIAIESLGFIVAHAFSVASAAMVAQKMGANKPEQAAEAGWISAGLGVAVLGTTGMLFWFFPETLLKCFTSDPEIIAMGVPCLRLAAWVQPLMAIYEAMAGGLRGAGDTRTPMIAAFIGPGVIRLALCWALAFHFEMGLYGIWVGTSVDWLVRVVILTTVFRRGRWKLLKV